MPYQLTGTQLVFAGVGGQSIDLGPVGSVTHVGHITLNEALDQGTIPVIPSLALHEDGGWLNVNADTAAAAVAGALQAEKAIFLTDTPGVLRDRRDPARDALDQSSRNNGAGCVRRASLAGPKLAAISNNTSPTTTDAVTTPGETMRVRKSPRSHATPMKASKPPSRSPGSPSRMPRAITSRPSARGPARGARARSGGCANFRLQPRCW